MTTRLAERPADKSPRSRRATIAPGESAAAFIDRVGLFSVDDQGIARLPMLASGTLLVPDLPTADEISEAIASGLPSVDVGETRLIMPDNAVVVGKKLRCLALPRVTDAAALAQHDTGDRIRSLHPLDFGAVASYVDAIGKEMSPAGTIVMRALPLAIACSDQPEYFVRLGFADVHSAFNGEAVGRAVDRELEFAGRPGRVYLNGWVDIADDIAAGGMAIARAKMGGLKAATPTGRRLRAFPTTQLHITAGNSPVVPAISALRAFATKGAVTVKLPSGALVAGAAFALALHVAAPDHPLTRHASIVYWAGGEEAVESALLRHGVFERIVVWGSRASVDAVASRVAGTKTLVFNPRYGISLIGRAALAPEMIQETVRRAAQDSFVWNQQACIASLVHYVEGSGEEIDRYCTALTRELALWDTAHSHHPDRVMVGRIRTARRGELSDGRWTFNGPPVAPTSAVVRMDRAFGLSGHPQARVVVVRPVNELAETLSLMHSSVSSVGVFPIDQVEELRDEICGRGVTSVIPLGEADTLFAGSPHDGIRALSELVSWSVS